MIDHRTLIMLAEYNAWADDTLFSAAAGLPDDSIYREKKTLFKTVVGTLNHNYQVDLIWQANLEGVDHGFSSRRDLLHPRFEDLIEAQAQSNRWYIDWAKRQDPASLARVVPFTYTSGPKAEMTRAAMFLHVINHKTFHRGWVSEMFFDLGSRPPQTDISVYLTEGHADRAGPD
jgi:uncharacterized damage-inducible protein DinB